jgi:hypothetical protein
MGKEWNSKTGKVAVALKGHPNAVFKKNTWPVVGKAVEE